MSIFNLQKYVFQVKKEKKTSFCLFQVPVAANTAKRLSCSALSTLLVLGQPYCHSRVLQTRMGFVIQNQLDLHLEEALTCVLLIEQMIIQRAAAISGIPMNVHLMQIAIHSLLAKTILLLLNWKCLHFFKDSKSVKLNGFAMLTG